MAASISTNALFARLLVSAVSALLLCLSVSCAGKPGLPETGNAAGVAGFDPSVLAARQLPAVAGLPAAQTRPRGDSFVDSDLVRLGEQFEAGLPSQNVEVFAAQQLALKPAQTGSSGLKGLAFAVYGYAVPGYDLEPRLHFSWGIPPQSGSGSDCWVTLANWDSGAWDWFDYAELSGSALELPDFAPYLDPGGQMYVALVLGGTQEAYLNQIRLGGVSPQPSLSASPRRGAPPLQVHLDASASLPGAGSAISFEWDPEGDGSYLPGNAELDWLYSEEGSFNATVRVSNELGNQATASLVISPGHYWQRSFGYLLAESVDGLAVDAGDNVLLAGTQFDSDPAVDSRIFVMKLNSAGQMLWTRFFARDNSDVYASSAAVDSEGNLVVCGTEYIGDLDAQCLLLKWDPDGNLLWSKIYGASEGDYAEQVRCDGTDIWFCGTTNSPADTLLCKVMPDGEIKYLRSRDLGSAEYGADLDFKHGLTGELTGVTVLSRISTAAGGQLGHVDYDSSGDFSSAALLADDSQGREPGHIRYSHNFITAQTRYTVSGTVEINSVKSPFVLTLPPSGDSVFGVRVSGLDCGSFGGLLSDGSGGNLLAVSGRFPGGDQAVHSCLLHLLSDGTLGSALELEAGGSYSSADALLSYGDGLLLAGFGPDAFGEYQNWGSGTQSYSDHWVDTPGSSTSPQWTTADSQGVASDADPGMVQDSGAGSFDALVSFVPLP